MRYRTDGRLGDNLCRMDNLCWMDSLKWAEAQTTYGVKQQEIVFKGHLSLL